ncbi:MAG: heat-inducible transcription repressor HrcA [Clostridia bacterium]|nr:heat-inducible transcription repressor HrcA [Clostridia bacterium]
MELTPRKSEILKAVIGTFIATGEPVGSKAIMGLMKTPCSSATIRNEMADLEKMGLLEQPHTSAGRIPTGRGYRVYVDSLMEDTTLSFEETLLLNSLLSDKMRETDQILSDMTSLLARLTGYAVISFTQERLGTIQRFEGVWVTAGSFLLVIVTSSGKAVSKQFRVELPLTPEGVERIISTLNEHLTRETLGGITLERIIAVEKDLGEYRGLMAPLLQTIYNMVAETGKECVMVRGTANLLSFPEFQEGDVPEKLIRELEDEEGLLSRFRQSFSDRIRIQIAPGGKGLDGASVVICPFKLHRSMEGTVCILGPKRMNYGKAVASLEYLAKQIHAAHGFRPQLPLIETKES